MFESEHNLQKMAVGFGILLLVVGVLGFIPTLTPDGLLLGLFAVNPAHNIIHLATGAAALMCGWSSDRASRGFFQTFGIIYGLVAVLGFVIHPHARGTDQLLGIVSINMADNLLHVLITAFSLLVGFAPRQTHQVTMRDVR